MFEKNILKNKVILVTGGGSGLGKSMAIRFAELGASLVIASRRKDVIADTTSQIRKTSKECLGLQCDVRDMDQVDNMIKNSLNKFGKIDILINNAAGNFISPTEMLSPGGFKAVVDIVLTGTFNCTLAVGKEMIKQKSGNILNIVTTYAWTGSGYVVPSASAKAGVLAMTRSFGKYNIRTNAIAPGPFITEGAWKRLAPPGFNIKKKLKNRIPLKRFGEHIELANLATYLISEQSGYINGEVVTIDGGEWLKGAGQFNDLDKLPIALWKTMKKIRTRSKK